VLAVLARSLVGAVEALQLAFLLVVATRARGRCAG